jgi:ABC-type transporter Mla subunit MlaD
VRNELKIGWVLLLAIGLVFGFLAWLKKSSLFYSGYPLHIWFQDVSGLREGDPVSLDGKISGFVSGIYRPGGDSAGWRVVAELEQSPKLRADASAVLKVREITGGRVVDIQSGSASGTAYSALVLQGISAWDAGTLLQEIQPLITFFKDSSLQTFIHNGNVLLTEVNRMNLSQSYQKLDVVLGHLDATLIQGSRLIRNLDEGVIPAVSEVRLTLNQLRTTLDTLTPVLSQTLNKDLKGLMTEVHPLVRELNKSLKKADELLTIVSGDTTSLTGAILRDPGFRKQTEETLQEVRRTLQEIREGRLKARVRF